MGRITCIILLMLIAVRIDAQNSKLSYFNLSVLNEEEVLPTTATVSAQYTLMDMIPLKGYTGSDPIVKRLSGLINILAKGEQGAYEKATVRRDSSIEDSYGFYNLFVSHSTEPKLYAKATLGRYCLLYVLLDRSMPLTSFCLEQQDDGSYLNHPEIMDHPSIITLTDAINKAYLFPDEFKARNNNPNSYTGLQFDSSFIHTPEGLSIFLNLHQVKFNVLDKKDTANTFDARYKPALEFYRKALEDLGADNLKAYYSRLSVQGKNRIELSMKKAGGEAVSFKYFKRIKMSLSSVKGIIDLGAVKVLLVTNPDAKKFYVLQPVYILDQNGKLTIINANMEFYFDDLIKTYQFRNALTAIKQ